MALTTTSQITTTSQFVPEEVAAGIIKDVRHTSAVMRLARKVPQATLTRTYNRRVSGPGAYWVADLERKTADKASWDQVNMTANELAVIVPVKERDFIGNPLDVWGEIREDIVESFAIAFDTACIFGNGSPWATSIMEEIGTNHITEETGEDLADDINLAMGLVESANYGPNGCLSLRSLKARLRGLRATGGEPIFQPAMTQDSTDMIYGLNTAFYTDVASWDQAVTCIVGDWNQVYYSVVQGISYKILDQATLTTVTDGSGNPMALAELDMIALRATMFTGFLPVKADEALAAVVTSGFGDTY